MRKELKMRKSLQLVVDVPEGVGNGELRSYVKEALATWGGGGDHDEPLFAGVAVKEIKIAKDYRLVNVRWHA